MEKWVFLSAAVLLLTACEQSAAPSGEQFEAINANVNASFENESIIEETVPGLPFTEADAVTKFEEIGQLKDRISDDRNDDSFSGGKAVHRIYRNGALDIFTLADGSLWRIRVVSGLADRCGKRFSNRAAVQAFVVSVLPDAEPSISDTLFKALQAGSMDEATVGTLKFTASGGCLQRLGVTEQRALP